MADTTITLADALDSVKGQQHRNAVYTLYNTAAATDATIVAENYANRMTTAETDIDDLFDIRRDAGIMQRRTQADTQYVYAADPPTVLNATWESVANGFGITTDTGAAGAMTLQADGAGVYWVEVWGYVYMGGTTNYWTWYIYADGQQVSSHNPVFKGFSQKSWVFWGQYITLAAGDVVDVRVKPTLNNNIRMEFGNFTIRRMTDAAL